MENVFKSSALKTSRIQNFVFSPLMTEELVLLLEPKQIRELKIDDNLIVSNALLQVFPLII